MFFSLFNIPVHTVWDVREVCKGCVCRWVCVEVGRSCNTVVSSAMRVWCESSRIQFTLMASLYWFFWALMDNKHQHVARFSHPSNFLFTRTPFTVAVAPANVLSLSKSIPIRGVYIHPLLSLLLFLHSARSSRRPRTMIDSQASWGDPSLIFLSVCQRAIVFFASPLLFLHFLLNRTSFLPPLVISSLSSQWTGNPAALQLTKTPEIWQEQKKNPLPLSPFLHLKGVWHASSLQLSELQ